MDTATFVIWSRRKNFSIIYLNSDFQLKRVETHCNTQLIYFDI